MKYAILSHVWDKFPPEQSYQEMVKIQEEVKDQRSGNPDLPSCAVLARLRPKIRECCKRAREDSIEFVWVDSCCIDKTSSGELTEAINSMFEWYSRAAVCYAFLADVSPEEDPLGVPSPSSTFRQSKWFKRCWTLQELIAPKALRFFSSDWTLINGKHELAVSSRKSPESTLIYFFIRNHCSPSASQRECFGRRDGSQLGRRTKRIR